MDQPNLFEVVRVFRSSYGKVVCQVDGDTVARVDAHTDNEMRQALSDYSASVPAARRKQFVDAAILAGVVMATYVHIGA